MKIRTKDGTPIDLHDERRIIDADERMSVDMSGRPRHWRKRGLLDALEAVLAIPYQEAPTPRPGLDDAEIAHIESFRDGWNAFRQATRNRAGVVEE